MPTSAGTMDRHAASEATPRIGAHIGSVQMLCENFLSMCPRPPPAPLDLDAWFAKPKPSPLPKRKPSGKRVKVLHLSDFHLDPRKVFIRKAMRRLTRIIGYDNGAEAECTSGLCCRDGSFNSSSDEIVFPAPRFGAWRWCVASPSGIFEPL